MKEELITLKKEVNALNEYVEKYNQNSSGNISINCGSTYSTCYQNFMARSLDENFDNIVGLKKLISNADEKNNIILMLDENNEIWELVKRQDLNYETFQTELENNNISSILESLPNKFNLINTDSSSNLNLSISEADFYVNTYSDWKKEMKEIIASR